MATAGDTPEPRAADDPVVKVLATFELFEMIFIHADLSIFALARAMRINQMARTVITKSKKLHSTIPGVRVFHTPELLEMIFIHADLSIYALPCAMRINKAACNVIKNSKALHSTMFWQKRQPVVEVEPWFDDQTATWNEWTFSYTNERSERSIELESLKFADFHLSGDFDMELDHPRLWFEEWDATLQKTLVIKATEDAEEDQDAFWRRTVDLEPKDETEKLHIVLEFVHYQFSEYLEREFEMPAGSTFGQVYDAVAEQILRIPLEVAYAGDEDCECCIDRELRRKCEAMYARLRNWMERDLAVPI